MESQHSKFWISLIIILLFLIQSSISRPLKPTADEGRIQSADFRINQASSNSQTIEYKASTAQEQRDQHSKVIMELKKQVRILQASFDSGEEDSMRGRYDPTRVSPGGPDPHHH